MRKLKDTLPYVIFWIIAIAIAVKYLFPFLFVTKDEAQVVSQVKEQIMKHEDIISVDYNKDFTSATTLLSTQLMRDIWKKAMKPSDQPNEGDYLVFYCRPTEYIYQEKEERLNDTYTGHLIYSTQYYVTKEQEKEFEEEAQSVLDSMNLETFSDYEKVRTIYKYICENIAYDYDHLDDTSYCLKYTAYAALHNKTAVCAGVAQLFYYMAKSADLDVHIDINDNHAWNFVKVDGKYYYVDATWDLGKTEKEYEYFLKGQSDFDSHHSAINYDFLLGHHDLSNSHMKYINEFAEKEY